MHFHFARRTQLFFSEKPALANNSLYIAFRKNTLQIMNSHLYRKLRVVKGHLHEMIVVWNIEFSIFTVCQA